MSILAPDARDRISEAVRSAEAGTSGEIVVMVSARAGTYRSVALLVALLCGLVLPWPMIWMTNLSAAAIALAQAGLVLALLAAGLSEPLRLALVPQHLRRTRAGDAARLAFWTRGLSRTRKRTGVLIYLAMAERHAEIVADAGILARIAPERWTGTIGRLLGALRQGEIEAGLVGAVHEVGAILAAEFPPEPGDRDELPNRVIVAD
nr:hypothetical protein [Methylobacterium planeticum]